jgi:hypothetical protein
MGSAFSNPNSVTNNYLAQQRAPIFDQQQNNPRLFNTLASIGESENSGKPLAVLESLFNRAAQSGTALNDFRTDVGQGPVTAENLATLRSELSAAATKNRAGPLGGGNPSDAGAAMNAIDWLDQRMQNLRQNPSAILSGSPADLDLWDQSRANWALQSRLGDIDTALFRAGENAASQNSGLGLENKVRQAFKGIEFSKQIGKFSPAEQAQISRIVHGSFLQNRLRQAGNMLGAGGGIGSMVSGAILGGGAGAALGDGSEGSTLPGVGAAMILGALARRGALGIQNRQIQALQAMTAARSPMGMMPAVTGRDPMPAIRAMLALRQAQNGGQ